MSRVVINDKEFRAINAFDFLFEMIVHDSIRPTLLLTTQSQKNVDVIKSELQCKYRNTLELIKSCHWQLTLSNSDSDARKSAEHIKKRNRCRSEN